GDLTEEGDMHVLRQTTAATLAEDVDPLTTAGAGEAAHVLDHTEDRRLDPLEHADPATDVAGCDLLRRGHHDRTIQVDCLHQRELGITGPRRHVDDEVIELAPFDLLEELPENPGDQRT